MENGYPEYFGKVKKRGIVVTSRDYADDLALNQAAQDLRAKQVATSFTDLATAQKVAWAKRWEKADVKIHGNMVSTLH